MDFLSEQQIYYTSKRYEPIYAFMNTQFNIKYHELFLLCATIGFKNNKIESFESRGRETRSTYFNSRQKSSIYSIIINDNDLGRQIDSFDDKTYVGECKRKLEMYAEGGMTILCSNVFKNKWQEPVLDSNYSDYDIDLMSYIYENTLTVPF